MKLSLLVVYIMHSSKYNTPSLDLKHISFVMSATQSVTYAYLISSGHKRVGTSGKTKQAVVCIMFHHT